MPLPDIKNLPLSSVELFGWPWHGLAVGGDVTLINSDLHPVVQPQSSNAFELRSPTAPAVSRTPAQVAAAEAAGQDWTNYQLQQGEKNNVIYGKATNTDTKINWVGFASDGTRWKITLNTTTINNATTGTQNLVFVVRKFGEMRDGQSDESYTRTISVNLADFLFSEWSGYGFLTFFTAFDIRLDAINSSGRLAVFSAVARVAFSGIKTGEASTLIDYPVAVFKAELTGTPPTLTVAVVGGGTPFFYQAFTYADGVELGGGEISQGSLRVLGGVINSSGAADVLIYLWRPKTTTSYFDMPFTYCVVSGWNARKARRVDPVDFDILIKTIVSGEIKLTIPMQMVIGWWKSDIIDYTYVPEDGSWNTVTKFEGGRGERILGFGYDDLNTSSPTDPYLIADPVTCPNSAGVTQSYQFTDPGPDDEPFARAHPIFEPAASVYECITETFSTQKLNLFNLDIFRVNANLFVIAHYDGSQWNMIQAVDTDGNVNPVTMNVPKIDLPYCAVDPVKNLFNHSYTTARTYL